VAEQYELSPSVVVLWAQRWEKTGSFAAKPSGGSVSPLEEHAEFLLALIVARPDLTLDEIVVARRKMRHFRQPQRGMAVLRATQHHL
jgi:transposase